LILVLLATASPSAAQVRSLRGPATPQAPDPQWSAVDQAVGKENYLEAKKQADAILQRGTPEDRQKTMLVYGRILLGLGQTDLARQYLNMLSKSGASAKAAVYGAWLKALDKKPDEAVKALEKMLQQAGGAPGETTAEAADVLAMLYMARGQQESAKKAVDFGLSCLQYRGTKDGYVLALLRGRLNSNFTAGEAKQLYDKAEELRQQGKFVEAGQLFAHVLAAYPKNPWGQASGFRIGQCYVGLGRPAQAVDWWQKFIKQSPAGPWRGQAQVAMVDLVFETQLDLKKATEHALAATKGLSQFSRSENGTVPLDAARDAEPSWKEAAYDIYLRQGIVSLVDGRFDAAVEGLQQAKQNLPSPPVRGAGGEGAAGETLSAGLDRLVEAAQNRVKLLPDELTIGDDRATVALVLGSIYSVLRQYDLAKGWFSLPLNGSLRSRSAGHRSFAGLGLARIFVATAGREGNSKAPKLSPLALAGAAYEASLKEYPKGSWHDDTLREFALLIERTAAEEFGPAVADKSARKKESSPLRASPRMPEADRQQQAKALMGARAVALPYWADLLSRFPASRHVPQALYHAGVLYVEANKPDEALAAFEELAKKYPASPWTGDAHVRLIDVKLEQQFDLPGGKQHADAAIAWYENAGAPGGEVSPMPPGQTRAVITGSTVFPDDTLPLLRQTGYDIYVRAGLVEYLLEHPERAVAFFEKAKPLAPERSFVEANGHIPTGMERLIEAAKSGKSLTPEIVRKGDERAKLILTLADVYHEGQQYDKSLDLCNRVLTGGPNKRIAPEQRSYAHFKRARNHFLIQDMTAFNPDAALADYVAAVRVAPKAPWADEAMFLAGNIEWNQKHDLSAAISVWQRLLKNYPHSSEAGRSAFFIGVSRYFSKQYAEAKKSLEKYVADYPDSEFIGDANELIDKCEKEVNKRDTP
jgi:tetratricopeptide (TPR) repeat protein